jgi:hypothetical protein
MRAGSAAEDHNGEMRVRIDSSAILSDDDLVGAVRAQGFGAEVMTSEAGSGSRGP